MSVSLHFRLKIPVLKYKALKCLKLCVLNQNELNRKFVLHHVVLFVNHHYRSLVYYYYYYVMTQMTFAIHRP